MCQWNFVYFGTFSVLLDSRTSLLVLCYRVYLVVLLLLCFTDIVFYSVVLLLLCILLTLCFDQSLLCFTVIVFYYFVLLCRIFHVKLTINSLINVTGPNRNECFKQK